MERSKHFFKVEEKSNGEVFWNGVFIQALGENRIKVKNEEYDVTSYIQKHFSDTKLTTKALNNIEKKVFDIPNNVGFYDMNHTKGSNSSGMKDALHNLPKALAKILNPPLPKNDNIEDSHEEITDLEGEGDEKTIIPSNIIDNYTNFEILLELNLSGHTYTLTEASNLIDEFYKRGEIQNEQQHRNVLNKFHTKKIELLCKILKQIASSTRPKTEEHILIVIDKSTYEEHLAQPLQTTNKQTKVAVTFLAGQKSIFIATNRNKKFHFTASTMMILLLFLFQPVHMNSRA